MRYRGNNLTVLLYKDYQNTKAYRLSSKLLLTYYSQQR